MSMQCRWCVHCSSRSSGNWVEPRRVHQLPFRPIGDGKVFCCLNTWNKHYSERNTHMSVELELEESVGYTPIQRMRHSAAHVMAEAIQEMFPDARFGIGPAIED